MTVGVRGWWAVLPLVLVLSCGPPLRAPRAVLPESDVCAECRMTVRDGHAAELIDTEGQTLVFDDPGCLALYVHDRPGQFSDAVFFVEDTGTNAWVPWESAVFVRADDVPSPMNYGWHAFADRPAAQAFAQTHDGRILPPGNALRALASDLEARRWRP